MTMKLYVVMFALVAGMFFSTAEKATALPQYGTSATYYCYPNGVHPVGGWTMSCGGVYSSWGGYGPYSINSSWSCEF